MPGVAWLGAHRKGNHMRKLVRRPSPAMVVACLALLVALGGTSVAAVSPARAEQRRHPQLRNNAVTNPKIRNNAVNSAEGREPLAAPRRTSRRASFPPGRPVRKAPPAQPGPQAPQAPPAPPASSARSRFARRPSSSTGGVAENGAYNTERVTALCQGNERAISAGTSWSDDAAGPRAHDAASSSRSSTRRTR